LSPESPGGCCQARRNIPKKEFDVLAKNAKTTKKM